MARAHGALNNKQVLQRALWQESSLMDMCAEVHLHACGALTRSLCSLQARMRKDVLVASRFIIAGDAFSRPPSPPVGRPLTPGLQERSSKHIRGGRHFPNGASVVATACASYFGGAPPIRPQLRVHSGPTQAPHSKRSRMSQSARLTERLRFIVPLPPEESGGSLDSTADSDPSDSSARSVPSLELAEESAPVGRGHVVSSSRSSGPVLEASSSESEAPIDAPADTTGTLGVGSSRKAMSDDDAWKNCTSPVRSRSGSMCSRCQNGQPPRV
mmetsp:Transcript_21333/g.45766  ORF Transcript_21333/g.45766 Transcript_21333/m.45766 type:complete len:271 (-) Transcript_21333:865-1677(-)